ncbi:MAG: T9SS type A sorting domain-containing protein [Bacteroidota bacterium]
MKTTKLAFFFTISWIFFFNTAKAQTPFSGTRTVGPGGYYATLTLALADAVTNGINGATAFELTSTYTSLSETFPITIGNISGASLTNTITIRPQTGAIGLSISSANATATIDLNGAQYFIIDGRPGGTGSFSIGVSMVISNTLGTAPAVRLINDARYNKIKYCDLQSNNSTITTATAGGGVVCFGTTTGANGNDFNTISNCDIHNVSGGNPLMCVFAYGTTTTTAQFNDYDTISNCNIYNYYNATTATMAVNLTTGTNGWLIDGNHFYQTTTLSYNGAVTHRVININNSTGNGFTVTNNFIGGNNSAGTNYYTMAGTTIPTTSTHVFIAIEVTVGATSTTNINNNTLTNIDFTSAVAGSLSIGGINILGGIANCNGNLIGSTTTNGSIKVTTNCTTNVGGMIALRSGTSVTSITFNNNIISGIDMYGNATTYTPEFHGINTAQTSTTITANNNVIGSTTLANSINLISTCATSTYAQRLDGFIINQTTAATVTLNNNIVSNLNTNYASTGTQAASVRGIYINPTSTGTYTVSNNIVRNLTSASQTTGSGINCAIIGVAVSTTTANVSVNGNQISSLVLTGTSTSAVVQCEGIFYSGMTTGINTINKNFIHSLSINAINPTAYLTGMDIGAGLVTISNNMIRLGYDSAGNSITTPCVIRGLTKNVSIVNMYSNSIYIGGLGVGSTATNTFAFARTAAAADDVRDNIFVNNRSNASTGGKHYQCYLINTTTLNLNYNNYFGNGTGAVFGTNNNGTSDVASYSSGWVSGDANSIVGDPQFNNPLGNATSVDLHISATIPTVIEKSGINIPAITDDFDGQLRASFSPEDIGADAGNYILNDVVAPAITIPSLLTNTVSTSDRIVSATITDATGIKFTGILKPRIYFRKSISGSYISNAGVYVSGTPQNSTWSFTITSATLGGVSAGDSIYYFIIAQDSLVAPNISSSPSGVSAFDVNTIFTYPPTQYGYKVSTSISGLKTVGTGGDYTNLTIAIADVASSVVTGPITLELISTYSSSLETFPITISFIQNLSSTNTLTIRPQFGTTGLNIISSNTTATIDLNGAQYIIIDGRPGSTGVKNLSIGNTSTTGVAIRFINDACFNKIIYDTVFGVNTSSTNGVIAFLTTTGTRGNDSNTVDNCDIKDGATTPTVCIYSSGTTTTTSQYNSYNFITNNNIYNFWLATAECDAFKVASGNTDWVMSGNSIFQTATRTATAAFQQYIWNLNNASANNHVITNNYVGGTAPLCGGTPWTATSTVGFRITGAYINVGAITPSTFSGNTFANFNLTSGGTAYATIPGVFSGPWLVGGLTNVTNNTFGSMTSVNSIVVNSSVNGNMIVPIGATGTTAGVINIRGNNFGGITASGTSASISSNLFAINTSSASTSITYNIDSNVIGNYLADNMIVTSASTSTTGQQICGYYSTSTSFINFRYNTIRNFRNNAIGTSITPTNWVHALDISGNSVDSIIGNTISNLTIGAAFQNNTTGSASLLGMRFVPATAGNFISGNQFYGFTQNNTGAASVSVCGIVTNNTLSPTIIQKNIFHSFNTLSTSTSSYIVGIYAGGGVAKYVNNIVRLGFDSVGNSITTTPTIYGIYKTAGSTNYFFNSVYLGGYSVGTGVANTFAFNSILAGVDSVMNNIFSNERSNASTGGTHYAISLSGNTTLTSNNNVYWYSGNGGTLGLYGASTVSSVPALTTLSSTDGNSGAVNPQFNNPTGGNSSIDLHINPYVPSPVEHNGIFLASVTDDFDGQTRSSLTPTDIGADAGNFMYTSLPVVLIDFSATKIKNDVELNWTTASEINNKGFDIERSVDGKTFEKINFVKGKGNAVSVNSYQFTDVSTPLDMTKVLYYRLKQIDFDGKFSFSKIVEVNLNNTVQNNITVYPNPFNSTISVNIFTETSQAFEICVTDLQGRNIATLNRTADKGLNTLQLDELNSLHQGIYLMQIKTSTETQTLKLIKSE